MPGPDEVLVMSGEMITSIHPGFPPACFKPLLLSCCITLALTNLASAQTFNVSVANDDGTGKENTLSWAILRANKNPGGDFINLLTDVKITSVMKRLLDSDITLRGNDHVIDGDHNFRPLFVKSGSVNLNHLRLLNGLALGGSSGIGGVGAGLGGALFIHSGAVTLDHVSIDNSDAIGGTAGLDSGKGGGGMFGSTHDTGGGGAGLFSDNAGAYGGYAGFGQYGGSGGLYYAYDGEDNIFPPGTPDFPAPCNSNCDLPAQLITGSVPYSCPDLHLSSNFWIAPGGIATLSATNSIELGSGFSVAVGGIARVTMNP